MQIWVDADACPKAIKDILFRVAERTKITTTLVTNQYLQTPPSRYIKLLQVKSGYDVADNEIVKRLSAGDLVITGDIPLANDVIGKGAYAINPRGERYTQENIKDHIIKARSHFFVCGLCQPRDNEDNSIYTHEII